MQTDPHPHPHMHPHTLALGLDTGGTQTRWALAEPGGAIVAQGHGAGFTALQMQTPDGRAAIVDALQAIAAAVRLRGLGAVRCAHAGVTGYDNDSDSDNDNDRHSDKHSDKAGGGAHKHRLPALMAHSLGIADLHVTSDIELACRAAFEPGEGYLVCAGTGSIAAFVDTANRMHRAGGRGGLLDDGGSGFWITRQALRRIWRREDETPGAWQHSALARALFAHIGGSDWASTRRWLYGVSRGEVGGAAVAVVAAAADDDEAREILVAAGAELARLALALIRRCGPRPVALAGRVFELDARIEAALRAALPADTVVRRIELAAHLAAARLALAMPLRPPI